MGPSNDCALCYILISFVYSLVQALEIVPYTSVQEFHMLKLYSTCCLEELQKLSLSHFSLLVVPPSSLTPINRDQTIFVSRNVPK